MSHPPTEFRVRPFLLAIEDSASPAKTVRGFIEDEWFCVRIEGRNLDGARFVLPVDRIEVDDEGAIATIRECKTAADGWTLLVEPTVYPGEDTVWCCISVWRAAEGVALNALQVVFNSYGRWNGHGFTHTH
jgi:hypothetical protein